MVRKAFSIISGVVLAATILIAIAALVALMYEKGELLDIAKGMASIVLAATVFIYGIGQIAEWITDFSTWRRKRNPCPKCYQSGGTVFSSCTILNCPKRVT